MVKRYSLPDTRSFNPKTGRAVTRKIRGQHPPFLIHINFIEKARGTRPKAYEQGGFYILHIPPGKYEITASKPGYITTRLERYINDKELMRLKVEMEKE